MQLQHAVPPPSSASLAFRSNLAKLISPLKRVRPSVPFWQLGAHRIPTLWGLYRGLLKAAPSDNIRHRVQVAFRRNRHLTGTGKTKKELEKGYKWLKTFQAAHAGDVKKQALLARYDSFIEMKIEKENWKQILRDEMEWQNRLKNRPILTGGLIHPTAHNPPLPRLLPQPPAISGMIVKRLRAQTRRFERLQGLQEMRDLIKEESFFECQAPNSAQYSGNAFREWTTPLQEARSEIYKINRGVLKRNIRPFPQALLDQVREARKNKIANKTKELERERRGEILKRTLERGRKGLPPPVWDKLPDKTRKEQLIMIRSVSEVGYVGMLKKRKGWKLREPKDKVEGKVWNVEGGEWVSVEETKRLDAENRRIERVNKRRRRKMELGLESSCT